MYQYIKNYFEQHHEAPQTTTEFYRIGKLLGKGAFGKVNLGMHKLTVKLVALKSINKEFLVDEKSKKITSKKMLVPPPHEPGVLPKWLQEQGANMIIAGGMGSRAQGLFDENGIKVMVGAPSVTPEQLVDAYMEGTLQPGENVCDH